MESEVNEKSSFEQHIRQVMFYVFFLYFFLSQFNCLIFYLNIQSLALIAFIFVTDNHSLDLYWNIEEKETIATKKLKESIQ